MLKYLYGRGKRRLKFLTHRGRRYRILSLRPILSFGGKEEIHVKGVRSGENFIISHYEIKVKSRRPRRSIFTKPFKSTRERSAPNVLTLRVVSFMVNGINGNENIINKIAIVESSDSTIEDIINDVSLQVNDKLVLNGDEINPHLTDHINTITTIDVKGIEEDVSIS